MSRRRVVITGSGLISPIGVGKEAFWHGLKEGADGITEISLFDTSDMMCHKGGEIVNFDAASFLGQKGLKYLDRSTQLIGSATGLALHDAGLSIPSTNELEIGLVVGTTFGSLNSISGFDIEALKEGPRYVNPMAFPKTVINSPAGHTAIKYGLTGLNTTISTGCVSGLHAINYAVNLIQMEQADILLAGGVEELCLASYLGFYKLKLLSGAKHREPEKVAPFDISRNGLVLGEGAGLLVLESLEHARNRKAKVYGEIIGFGNAHDAYHTCRYNPEGVGATRAMLLALQDAELEPHDVDYICASANGSPLGDKMEAKSIQKVFGKYTSDVAIHSLKSMVGESLGASGAFQVASSLVTLTEGIIPPTLNFKECEPGWKLDGLSDQVMWRDVAIAMINAFGCDGNNASLVLSRWDSP
ncbi:beta-ketoacyl-[acyl-carrier-protein] synthase family protein [Candidatus Poribacteria bacterium]|nr:beta-ketoacyl-[acyl-carrier-protein] synthase family protein [Candidatus Poribacteria bacterium]